MHGLINRMMQVFVVDTYGEACWSRAVLRADVGAVEFDILVGDDKERTDRLMAAISAELQRPIGAVLEDVGTYLVSHPNAQSIRRLLRFCGTDFVDFLHSLEEFPERARLVLAELRLPDIEVTENGGTRFEIRCRGDLPMFLHLLAGLVRAMADDYGALALLDQAHCPGGSDCLVVTLVQSDYAESRSFALGLEAPRP